MTLSPGDGRAVARVLANVYGTAVLFATGQSSEVDGMRGTGAVACLPKPYCAEIMPQALDAIARLTEGDCSTPLPDHMFTLANA